MNRAEIKMIYKAISNLESSYSMELTDSDIKDNVFDQTLEKLNISEKEKDLLQKLYTEAKWENHENGFIDGFSYACHLFM